MYKIDKELFSDLYDQTWANQCLQHSFDLCSSVDDCSQGKQNTLMPKTQVCISRHQNCSVNMILISGKLECVLYEEDRTLETFPKGMDAQDVILGKRLKETARYLLDSSLGNFECVVPKGAWHTIEVLEPSIISVTSN